MRNAEEVTFGATALDRAAHLRGDLATLLARPDARAVVFWRGKPLVRTGAAPSLLRVPVDHPVTGAARRQPIFLGLADGGAPVVAVDISPWQPDDLNQAAMAEFFDSSTNHHPEMDPDDLFVELRGVMAQLSPADANIAATARAVLSWHDTHPHCAKCGAKSAIAEGGWQRTCPVCSADHFPRTDPVVIVLVTHGNSVLLGRSPHWPAGMYSLLAGFVEPGETIEAASRREVFEESGIRLGPVRYLSSQPWPYPTSLMFGTGGEALNTDITLDPNELEDAQWVRREDVLAAMAGENPGLKPARAGSIARFLLDKWVADDLE